MKVVWRLDKATVRDVYEALREKRTIAYTTVMTMMKILEEKGYLKKIAGRARLRVPAGAAAAAGRRRDGPRLRRSRLRRRRRRAAAAPGEGRRLSEGRARHQITPASSEEMEADDGCHDALEPARVESADRARRRRGGGVCRGSFASMRPSIRHAFWRVVLAACLRCRSCSRGRPRPVCLAFAEPPTSSCAVPTDAVSGRRSGRAACRRSSPCQPRRRALAGSYVALVLAAGAVAAPGLAGRSGSSRASAAAAHRRS